MLEGMCMQKLCQKQEITLKSISSIPIVAYDVLLSAILVSSTTGVPSRTSLQN